MGRSPKVLIIGLDGAGTDLIERFVREGAMPNMAALARKGCFGPLRSTVPPVTFPAWTSFLTGAEPSTHGIVDFTVREGYSVRFIGAPDRAVPTFLEHLEGLGHRCGAAWFPVTYPPGPLSGYHIAGWDSPVTSVGDPSFVHPPRIHRELEKRFGNDHLSFDTVDEFESSEDWYLTTGRALPLRLRRRGEMAAWLLDNQPVDVAAFYFGETDTAAHHFWAFHDETSPRRPRVFPEELAGVITETYRAADDVIGQLVSRLDDNAHVVILSDHGSAGSSDLAVHLNRALQDAGLLTFMGTGGLSSAAQLIRGKAVGIIPSRFRRALFRFHGGVAPGLFESRIRFGGIDWSKTLAFSEELNYAPSVWFNQRGREPEGIMRAAMRDEVAGRVIEALTALRSPDGAPLVERVTRREEQHFGALAHLLPDLTVTLRSVRGHTPACLPSASRSGPLVVRIKGKALLGRKGRSLPGCHSANGILLASGPMTTPDAQFVGSPSLHDVAPMVYRMLAAPAAPWFEGRSPLPTDDVEATEPDSDYPDQAVPSTPRRSYTLDEEAVVAGRLKRLGYLED